MAVVMAGNISERCRWASEGAVGGPKTFFCLAVPVIGFWGVFYLIYLEIFSKDADINGWRNKIHLKTEIFHWERWVQKCIFAPHFATPLVVPSRRNLVILEGNVSIFRKMQSLSPNSLRGRIIGVGIFPAQGVGTRRILQNVVIDFRANLPGIEEHPDVGYGEKNLGVVIITFEPGSFFWTRILQFFKVWGTLAKNGGGLEAYG
jgi:hypothetical protein